MFYNRMLPIWFMVLQCILYFVLIDASSIGDSLHVKLRTFSNDGLGVQQYQSYLDNYVTFNNDNLDAATLASQIGQSMSTRLLSRIDALTNLKQELELEYESVSSSNPFPDCCTVNVGEIDPLLNTQVNYDTVCTMGTGMSSAGQFLSSRISDIVKQQYQSAVGIKFAYFGSEEGVMYNYPALRVCDSQYDPRFRPWYVETASPLPKDIVVVIDKSGSMGNSHNGQTLMTIAKNAAKTVIDTLNPIDRVGVVAFSTYAQVPSGISTSTCYQIQLAKATAQNKNYFSTYIDSISQDGATYYATALKKAFEYFTNTPNNLNDTNDRDKVILFLTDGEPSDGRTSIDTINTENNKLNNTVKILTYGLGNINNGGAEVLTDMANQVNTDQAFGARNIGQYTHVQNPDNLRSSMASYYNHFTQTSSSQVVFTVPYIDAFGTGLLVSMCLPVMYQNNLKGVSCMDLAVDDMLSDITYFREGEKSYAFIIDGTSRVLTHPLLSFASEVTNNPYFIYLNAMEYGIDDITQSMKRGGNGTRRVASSLRITPRGNVKLEGVDWSPLTSTYSWYPVSGTDFSVCLVIGDGDQRTNIEWTGDYPSYLYHRLDLHQGSLSTCKQFTRLSVKERSSVSFAARSFQDPFNYLNTAETINILNGYEAYLSGRSNYNPWFKTGIRESLAATAQFDTLMQTRSQYGLYSVWRYVTTDNGIYRIWPAVEIPKTYDATRRTWYLRSKAYKGMLTVSTPYVDAFGAGIVVTLSHVVYEGNNGVSSHSSTDKTIGVMGMDFTIQYFYQLMTKDTDLCQTYTCMIIDKSGYIVAHKDWIYTYGFQPTVEDIHIAWYDPGLASMLVSSNIMVYDGCINIEQLQDQYVWKVESASDKIYNEYELHVIPETNIYFIVRKQITHGNCSSCITYTDCIFGLENGCSCPCKENANIYDHCLGEFDISGDSLKPCTPPFPSIDFSTIIMKESYIITMLDNCYDYHCNDLAKSTQEDCRSVVACEWCLYDRDGYPIDAPYCADSNVCPYGWLNSSASRETTASQETSFLDTRLQEHATTPAITSKVSSPTRTIEWWIFLIILLPVLAIIVGVLIYFYCKKRLCNKPATLETNYTRDPPTAPAADGFTNLAFVSQHDAPPTYDDAVIYYNK